MKLSKDMHFKDSNNLDYFITYAGKYNVRYTHEPHGYEYKVVRSVWENWNLTFIEGKYHNKRQRIQDGTIRFKDYTLFIEKGYVVAAITNKLPITLLHVYRYTKYGDYILASVKIQTFICGYYKGLYDIL